MVDFLFHRCGMHHEEFQLFSSSPEFSDQWKRNPLCSKEIRATNIFCSHGSALLRLLREGRLESAPEIQEELLRLQTQLFAIDHQKGELEKYVFQIDEEILVSCKKKLKELNQEYHLICDQIEAILSEEANFEASHHPIPKE